MRKMKVLLAIQPRMLLEIIRHTLEHQPDMEVVRELSGPGGLLFAIRATKAEVVITTPATADREPELSRSLLAVWPHLKIIALSATEDTALLYVAGLPTQRIDDMGAESLLRAIRAFMG
jgi:DNA-binding NarL/FixJ family response regulator